MGLSNHRGGLNIGVPDSHDVCRGAGRGTGRLEDLSTHRNTMTPPLSCFRRVFAGESFRHGGENREICRLRQRNTLEEPIQGVLKSKLGGIYCDSDREQVVK
jgi:hypothetical protein